MYDFRMGACGRYAAFSLVELSIVLVILGLLTGGILAGQALIRAAELRSIGTGIARYVAAAHGFRDKYFYLPGDMPNAVQFWGAAAGGLGNGKDAACAAYTTAATGTETCNGDGNGAFTTSGNNVADNYETWRAWQHLANAGLVEGSYSGVTADASRADGGAVGVNMPAARIANVGFNWWRLSDAASDVNWYALGRYGNLMMVGRAVSPISGNSSLPVYPFLKPEEMWGIDSKIDDGRPTSGSIIGRKASSPAHPGCTTSDDAATAAYSLSTMDIVCAPTVRLGF